MALEMFAAKSFSAKRVNFLLSLASAFALIGCGLIPQQADSDQVSKRQAERLCHEASLINSSAKFLAQPGTQGTPSTKAFLFDLNPEPETPSRKQKLSAFEVSAFFPEPKIAPWEHVTFTPFKTSTRFQVIPCAGLSSDSIQEPVIRVLTSSSVSALTRPLNRAVSENSQLHWNWKIVRENMQARINEPGKEDSPIRVVLAFEGDKSKLPEAEQQKLSRMELITRRPSPYATLMYSIGQGVDLHHIETSRHTATVKIKAVQNANSPQTVANGWVSFQRNIHDDYVRAFGEPPGRLQSISILGDSDNTKQISDGYITGLALTD